MTDTVREAFEKWLLSIKPNAVFTPYGDTYFNATTRNRWVGFKAGRESMREDVVRELSEQWRGSMLLENKNNSSSSIHYCVLAIKELP